MFEKEISINNLQCGVKSNQTFYQHFPKYSKYTTDISILQPFYFDLWFRYTWFSLGLYIDIYSTDVICRILTSARLKQLNRA